MSVPNLKPDDIRSIFPNVESVGDPKRGGQKIAFPCMFDGELCMLKLVQLEQRPSREERESVEILPDDIAARINREISTLRECDSSHLVKLGSIPVRAVEYLGLPLLYYSEEYIDGVSLDETLRSSHQLPKLEIIRLGKEVGEAIRVLWAIRKVHRDIKPDNIMLERASGRYVLLDMGFVLDTQDVWLTSPGLIPGTVPYLSPEQTDLTRKRYLDFRSDLFQLGVVMYEAATGVHPFRTSPRMTRSDIIGNILQLAPASPQLLRMEIGKDLCKIIERLMEKEPHSRFRTPDRFLAAMAQLT